MLCFDVLLIPFSHHKLCTERKTTAVKVKGEEDELCENLSNLSTGDGNEESTSEEDKTPAEKYAKGLEYKAARDELEEMLSKEEIAKDLTESELNNCQLRMAMATLHYMICCGIIEEEKHSSVVYVEEHADIMFEDRGEGFRRDLDWAFMYARIAKIKNDPERKALLEKLGNEGNMEGYLRILQEGVLVCNEEKNAFYARHGMPPPIHEDPFLGTLIDDELFAPSPPRSECPICLLALPMREHGWTYQPCCGKVRLVEIIFVVVIMIWIKDAGLNLFCYFFVGPLHRMYMGA